MINFLRVIVFCLLCVIPGMVHASEITLALRETDATPIFFENLSADRNGDFTYFAQPGETIEMVLPDRELAADIVRLEYQGTTSWAISDEGPSIDLKSLQTKSGWEDISLIAIKDKIAELHKQNYPPLSPLTPQQLDLAREGIRNDNEIANPESWVPLLEKCGDTSDPYPCYRYHSRDTFRFTLKNQKQILLTVFYPSGC